MQMSDLEESSNATEPVHLAFGVDAGYFHGMGVAITSVLEHNPDLSFVFHVFAFTIGDDDRARLEMLEAKHGMPVHVHLLDPAALDAFRDFPCFAQHSIGTFIRLLIPKRLQGTTDRVLYLDADLLCFGHLKPLMALDPGPLIASAVLDEAGTTVSTQVAELGLSQHAYFNAGVMLINVDAWVAHDVERKALAILSSRSLRFADQDALNIVLDGQVRYIEDQWNKRYHLVDALMRGERRMSLRGPYVLVHFTGPVKPWHSWCLNESRDIFLDVQSRSPWAGAPLDGPRTARELKLFSKFLVRQHRLLEGIGWHLKYLGVRLLASMRA